MSNSTTMSIRIDNDVKKQSQELFSQFGLDMTTAINIFLRQSIRHRGLPFSVSLDNPNSIDEQIFKAALNKSTIVPLDADDNGNILIDKDKHPELYEWAVNG